MNAKETSETLNLMEILQHSFFFFLFLSQKVLHERGFSKLKASRARNQWVASSNKFKIFFEDFESSFEDLS